MTDAEAANRLAKWAKRRKQSKGARAKVRRPSPCEQGGSYAAMLERASTGNPR